MQLKKKKILKARRQERRAHKENTHISRLASSAGGGRSTETKYGISLFFDQKQLKPRQITRSTRRSCVICRLSFCLFPSFSLFFFISLCFYWHFSVSILPQYPFRATCADFSNLCSSRLSLSARIYSKGRVYLCSCGPGRERTGSRFEKDFSALTFFLNDLRHSRRVGYIGMFLNLSHNIIPDISLSTNSHIERKTVRAKALVLAAKERAAGARDVVDVV